MAGGSSFKAENLLHREMWLDRNGRNAKASERRPTLCRMITSTPYFRSIRIQKTIPGEDAEPARVH